MFANQETADFMDATGIPNDATMINKEKGITGERALRAVDKFITAQKANGVWDKTESVYGFKNAPHINLKDSPPTDGAFRLTFDGRGITS